MVNKDVYKVTSFEPFIQLLLIDRWCTYELIRRAYDLCGLFDEIDDIWWQFAGEISVTSRWNYSAPRRAWPWAQLMELTFASKLYVTRGLWGVVLIYARRARGRWGARWGLPLKPGFHYPSWRPELTARVDGWPVSIIRQHGSCWRARVSTSRYIYLYSP